MPYLAPCCTGDDGYSMPGHFMLSCLPHLYTASPLEMLQVPGISWAISDSPRTDAIVLDAHILKILLSNTPVKGPGARPFCLAFARAIRCVSKTLRLLFPMKLTLLRQQLS